jgi:Na+-transporting NADH:ubiquinone oxidoreductase subunit NqrB
MSEGGAFGIQTISFELMINVIQLFSTLIQSTATMNDDVLSSSITVTLFMIFGSRTSARYTFHAHIYVAAYFSKQFVDTVNPSIRT